MAANRDQRSASRHAGAVETSNEVLNEALCRAMADLRMLITETPEGSYPYAGIPWYSTTFGRDGLLTALQMLWCDPLIAKGVLKRLAAFQVRKRIILRKAGQELFETLREVEKSTLARTRRSLFGAMVDGFPPAMSGGGYGSLLPQGRR